MYKVLDIAELFIYLANFDGDNTLSYNKLQKMLYYAQGWYSANYNKRLFNDKIEAWKYGPVIPIIYNKYKKHKSNNINIEDVDNINGLDKKFDTDTLKFLNDLYSMYIEYSAHRLVYSSHNEKPWKETYDVENNKKVIKYTKIKSYFKERLKNKNDLRNNTGI